MENKIQAEPNFDSWGADGEYMHEFRIGMVARAAASGAQGWQFAEEMAGRAYRCARRDEVTVLASLITQGYLASDLDNPHIVRITDAGHEWLDGLRALQAANLQT